MEEITQYKANDGSIHKTRDEALKRDRLMETMNAVKALLPPKPPYESGWGNGEVYLQCKALNVKTAKDLFTSLYNRQFNSSAGFPQINGRLLDDSGSPLYGLWNTLTWIDGQNRMWGQGYYKNNPNPKATEYKP